MLTDDHAKRAHAYWSASATARNWYCPGALAMQSVAPDESPSLAAAQGTYCHEVAETCLQTGQEATAFLGDKRNIKGFDITFDEDLALSAQTYLDYINNRRQVYARTHYAGAVLWVEQKFSLAELDPPFEAGGTGDAVIYFPEYDELEVVDLKNGLGIVDPANNPQLRTYGLGALLLHKNLKVKTIRVTIVQPRAEHPDGRIRSEVLHVADLIEWTADLIKAMHRSDEASKAFPGVDAGTAYDEWSAQWLSAGACKFCRAAGFCPALRAKAQELVKIWFEPVEDGFEAPPSPNALSGPEIARVLDMAQLIETWISGVRSYAHFVAERGSGIPGYQLVERRSRRRWISDDDALIADRLALFTRRLPADFFELKLMSPAQAEKVIGLKNKVSIASLWESKSSGTNLVRTEKTTRPAIKGIVERYFIPITEDE